MSKDHDSTVERELGAAEDALPSAVTPPRPEKAMLPAWQLALWGLDPEADPAATRASLNAMFKRKPDA